MSTQFRSRIKGSVSYASAIEATGGCCLPDGSKIFGDTVTLSECNKQNGYFQKGDPDLLQCPERGLTGCCCACSYIREQDGDDFAAFTEDVFGSGNFYYGGVSNTDNFNEKGIKDNVTQCECNSRGGKWFYGKCKEIGTLEALCGSVNNTPPNDVRLPAACCHGNTLTNELNCTNVCTTKECSELATTEYPYTNYFGDEVGGSGSLCSGSGARGNIGEVDCSVDSLAGGERIAASNTPQNETEAFFSAMSRLVPCLELTTVSNQLTHTCSMKTPIDCYAVSGFEYSEPNNKVPKCADVVVYTPARGVGSGRVTPPSTSLSNMPNIGDQFQGGIFAGVFEPGVSTVTRRRGSNMVIETARKEGNGTNRRRWGLIISFRPYGNDDQQFQIPLNKNKFSLNGRSEPLLQIPTSFYDGFYNTYGDGTEYSGYNSELFEDIRSLVLSGFNDWYVPSIDELSYIYKNHNNLFCSGYISDCYFVNYFSGLDYGLQYTNMMSSTLWSENDKLGKDSSDGSGQIVRRRGYVYVQNMAPSADGERNGLIYKEDRRTQLMVPLVRRIYIDQENNYGMRM